MKEVVVLSGKGGTGKTSIVACFAVLARSKVLVDCDVDAADLYLLLQPEVKEENEFWSGQVACIDKEKCTECGLCQELCRSEAIQNYVVDAISCEGCGFCYQVCPVNAVTMHPCMAGHWFTSDTRYGTLVHARLGIAEENSGKLVTLVRNKARLIAEKGDVHHIITDGPPGIGCPAIASLSGANLALLVTEPTLSGIHDLERVTALCRHFGVLPMVCINKYDINEENTHRIENYCYDERIEIGGEILFDNVVTEALTKGLPVVDYSNSEVTQQIKELWRVISTRLDKLDK